MIWRFMEEGVIIKYKSEKEEITIFIVTKRKR